MPSHHDKREYDRKRTAERRAFIQEAKSIPCHDCKNSYPFYIMQFDHVRGKKKTSVAKMLRYSFETITSEIAKCEVVCANCHATRTWNRINGGFA